MEAKRLTKQPRVGPSRAEEPTCLPGAACDSWDSEHCGSVSYPQSTPNSRIRLEPAATTEYAEKKGPVPRDWGARSPSSFQTHKCTGSSKQLGFKARLIRLQLHLRGSPPRGRLQPSRGIITEQQKPDGRPQRAVLIIPSPDPHPHGSRPPSAVSQAFRPRLPSARPLEFMDEGGD